MPSNDPDIRNEPHLRTAGSLPKLDPAIDSPLGFESKATEFSISSDEDIAHSVWDEPSLTPQLAEIPESALTYTNWLQTRTETWNQGNAWAVTLVIAALSVPCAAIAAIVSWTMGNIFIVSDLIVACLIGPTLQEICKILVPLWVVEKRPYFFSTWFQFFMIAIVTALSFTVVSNLFLTIAIDTAEIKIDGGQLFVFQWIGMLGLNLITATIASFGLERIWRTCVKNSQPPQLANGYPFFAAALGLHILFAIGSTIWIFTSGIDRLFTL